MQYLKNERGMTLVIVLLTITVFTVLGMTVIGASLSNVKQVTKVEDDIQTIDIAEMGVQHYQAKLNDFFHEKIAAKKIEYKTLIENKFITEGAVTDNDIEQYEEQLAGELVEYFEESVEFAPTNNILLNTVDSATNSYYKIDKTNAVLSCPTCNSITNDDGERLELNYKSYGYTEQNPEKLITAKFVFTFSINKDGITVKTSTAQNYNYQTIIPKPTGLNACSSDMAGTGSNGRDSFVSLNCQFNHIVKVEKPSEIKDSNLVFENGVTFDKQINKGIENSTLYITGATNINKQINGIHNSKIFIQGNTKIETINQGIHNSTIVVIGDVIFGDNNDKFKDLEHSSIYVIGNANFTNMDFSNFSSTAKVCVKGNVTGTANIAGHPIYYENQANQELFVQKCALGVITDGAKTIEINDQFMDWVEKADPEVKYE